MHPQIRAFLAALAERPDDRTTMLVFADWLDEHDEPTEALWYQLTVEDLDLQDLVVKMRAALDQPPPRGTLAGRAVTWNGWRKLLRQRNEIRNRLADLEGVWLVDPDPADPNNWRKTPCPEEIRYFERGSIQT